MTSIGFIGLGTMGGPMALNIVKGGYKVKGFDIDETLVKYHSKNNGIVAKTASEAALDTDILFTMLPNSDHVKSALFDENGAIENLKNGSIVIDMSTINPIETDGIREKLKEKGISMIDAPIGRTSVEARIGKSLLMLGGEKNDIENCKFDKEEPLFLQVEIEQFGKRISIHEHLCNFYLEKQFKNSLLVRKRVLYLQPFLGDKSIFLGTIEE